MNHRQREIIYLQERLKKDFITVSAFAEFYGFSVEFARAVIAEGGRLIRIQTSNTTQQKENENGTIHNQGNSQGRSISRSDCDGERCDSSGADIEGSVSEHDGSH